MIPAVLNDNRDRGTHRSPMQNGKPHNYKLTVKYDGTHFSGWQAQPETRTVQQTIEQAIEDVFGERVRVHASGRTDTGVHAVGQVIHFHLQAGHSPSDVKDRLNDRLPEDVRVSDAEEMPSDFHSRYSAVGKQYRYTIFRQRKPRFNRRSDVYYWGGLLDIDKMRQAASCLVGEHDFSSFGNNPKYEVPNKVKTITKLDIRKEGDYIYIDVKGSGFLYKMVRSIVGTLLWVGTGKIPPENMQDILDARDRTKAGPAADAAGLCLMEVEYPE